MNRSIIVTYEIDNNNRYRLYLKELGTSKLFPLYILTNQNSRQFFNCNLNQVSIV